MTAQKVTAHGFSTIAKSVAAIFAGRSPAGWRRPNQPLKQTAALSVCSKNRSLPTAAVADRGRSGDAGAPELFIWFFGTGIPCIL